MDSLKNYFKEKLVYKGLIAVAIYATMMYGFPELVSLIIDAIFSDAFIENHIISLNCAINLLCDVPMVIALYFLFKPELHNEFTNARINTHKLSKAIGFGLLISYIASFLANIIIVRFDVPESTNQIVIEKMLSDGIFGFITMFICAGIIGPVIEELVFRKAIFGICKNKYVGAVISTFLFGLIHVLTSDGTFVQKLIIGLPYFVSGASFSFIYIKNDRNIIIPIAVHMLSNLISVVLLTVL